MADDNNNNGYHLSKIPKGVLGQSSKILEEIMELRDAEIQYCKIMQLMELSDIAGAIKAYLRTNFPDISFNDLLVMSDITERAFKSGERK